MKLRKLLTGILASVGFGMLVLDSKTALLGAKDGVELCLQTVIPSLFPFFIISVLFVNTIGAIHAPPLRWICKLAGIPNGADSLLIIGLLGGYPTGAQAVSEAYKAGRISRTNAIRMLHFCSNAGPAFLFGMVSSLLPSQKYTWCLWGIHITSALIVSLFLAVDNSQGIAVGSYSDLTVSQAMQQSIRSMASVCGWVIVFRVIITYLKRWFLWRLPMELQILVTGLMELTNGCQMLFQIENLQNRFLFCSLMLSFGGICVIMQTDSVIGNLPLGAYLRGKIMQTLLSFLFCIGIVHRTLFFYCSAVLLILLLLRKKQKNCSNPRPVVV